MVIYSGYTDISHVVVLANKTTGVTSFSALWV